ncbi:Acyltransferase [Aphelenchoides bicaudatus]|nr:Acyltransferase [Aphelenchoides bicaudatus]
MSSTTPLVDKQFAQRLQVLAVTKYMFIFLISPFLSLALTVYLLLYTRLWWLMSLYLVWLYFDWDIGRTWYRDHWIWKRMRDYFPVDLVKTADLPSNKNYVFCCHPHGLLSVSTFVNFCTNANRFDEKFPGLQPYPATLAGQFYFPFRREIIIALGVIAASVRGIEKIIKRPGGGNVVCLVVGGAEEALDSHEGDYSLYINKRKGFVRLAIQNGASLVPVYSFGENDAFHQLDNHKGSRLRQFQSEFKKRIGLSPVLFYGTGILSKYGILPYRKRLSTVVGAPIHLEKNPNPTQEEIDVIHAKYVAKLVELFEAHKHKYNIKGDAHLVLN